ncbi:MULTISPECIES: hypothetical protein [Bacillaceae]|uniref:Uncharacterized protein n=1 Tax=Evansella alkalicola TaxID=745819 RepID=A0ABS6JPQ5_9BACI|nr:MULTISPECIES: hypothetical protein [Bacillaceae]MBU9720549.1 hypothetical protein [Bacillus alkalicola]
MITKDNLFFCYNKNLCLFLKEDKGIYSITTAIHPTTKKMFTLFAKSEELQKALDEYKAQN